MHADDVVVRGEAAARDARPPAGRWLDHAAAALVFYAAALSFCAVPILASRGVPSLPALYGVAAGSAGVAIALLLAWRWGEAYLDAFARAWTAMPLARASSGIWQLIAVGVALRLTVALILPAQPVSDGVVYLGLAQALVEGRPYAAGGTLAYWPPGYPLFLAPWLAVFEARTATIASGLFLFLVAALGTLALARRMVPEAWARLALAVVVLWPNLVFQSGIPEKEQVLIALLPWILALWLDALRGCGTRGAWARALASGALLGFCCLVQPAVQLLPAVLVAACIVAGTAWRWSAAVVALVIAGMTLAIAPWTVRNHAVLGEFVLISTNGGSGLYRANNPMATGGYTERGEHDLSGLGEVVADRTGKRLAREWILGNPGAFVRLAFEKNIRYMGDDAVGPYHVLKRVHGENATSTPFYLAMRALSNAYWLTLMAAILCGLLAAWRRGAARDTGQVLCIMAFGYSFALHSIFESAGKYHVLWSCVVAVLVATMVARAPSRVRAGRPATSGRWDPPGAVSGPSRS